MFGDEASFWLDGTLHVTWSRVGVQPRVDTFGARKTAHVYGAISIETRPYFVYQFAAKWSTVSSANGCTETLGFWHARLARAPPQPRPTRQDTGGHCARSGDGTRGTSHGSRHVMTRRSRRSGDTLRRSGGGSRLPSL
jgi:hypothetical protein